MKCQKIRDSYLIICSLFICKKRNRKNSSLCKRGRNQRIAGVIACIYSPWGLYTRIWWKQGIYCVLPHVSHTCLMESKFSKCGGVMECMKVSWVFGKVLNQPCKMGVVALICRNNHIPPRSISISKCKRVQMTHNTICECQEKLRGKWQWSTWKLAECCLEKFCVTM